MQHRKILVACLTLLLVGLVLPAATIPRAHAFLANRSLSVSGLALSGYTDSTVNPSGSDVATGGSTLTFSVAVLANTITPDHPRNVTVGIKFDWMSSYQNASNAGSSSTLTLTNGQEASVSISVQLLSTTGNIAHTWSLLIGNGPQNKAIPPSCSSADGDPPGTPSVCLTFSNFALGRNAIQIWSGDQVSAAQAKFQAGTIIANVNTAIGFGGSGAATTAASQLAQARTESSLGDQSWNSGDYSGAKTHYQNAVNNANAAASSLANLGGGSTNAGIVSAILSGSGIAMFGIGGLLAGIGGFFYLKRKPKA